MTDWAAGYVADIGYTYGYYRELNPLRLDLALLDSGLVPQKVNTACELGFGQGMSINLHAAATGVSWWGTDFNPAQAGFAQELATGSGADVRLFDQAFAEFCARPDLPEFDFIGLHGIWSWISDENRAAIVEFLRRKLRVGGVLYISYNTQPGWATMVPLRDLLTEHAASLGAPGHGIVSRIDGALAFAEKLMATKPQFAQVYPQVGQRLNSLKAQSRTYLAHEYFNRDWLPSSFARMAEWLEPAKLDFAGSAHYLDHVDALHLSADQDALLREIPDAGFRQTVRDFCVNQQFRRDYWVKGARRLNPVDKARALRAQRLILVKPRGDVSLSVTGSLGKAALQEDVYGPILDLLSDHIPRSLGQIEEALAGKINLSRLVQAALVLCAMETLEVVQEGSAIAQVRPRCDTLNAHVMQKARGGKDISYLASPVTGGGVTVGRVEQLFLLALRQGTQNPAEWAQFAWRTFSSQQQRLVKEGKQLESVEENLAELSAQAHAFAEKRLPVLKALQLV